VALGGEGPAYNDPMTDADVDFALNLAYDRAGKELVLVKLSAPAWEFDFYATSEQLAGLASIRDADWRARRCLHIGKSAGAPVHWAAEEETVTIMVGHDPETWDIGLMVSVATVDKIVAEAADGSWRLGYYKPA